MAFPDNYEENTGRCMGQYKDHNWATTGHPLRHRCIDCGFTSHSHFWQCPACKTWDSQRPVVRFEFGLGHEAAARRE